MTCSCKQLLQHDMFSYNKYIYHGLRNHLLTTWRSPHFPTYGTCRAIQTTYTYLSHIFHYRTYLHATNSPCHYHVCMPWFPSHDQSYHSLPIPHPLPQNASVEDRHSQTTFIPSRLNNYTNMYAGTIIS